MNSQSVGSRTGATPSLVQRLLREPLLHFLVAAALLFVLNAALAVDDRDVIVVDSATQAFLIQQQEDLLLRPLTDEEKTDIVETYIEEEILIREARQRGLDNSSRIRRLLVQNMRFFYLDDDLQRPTEEQLREYFESRKGEFTTPAARVFDQVFYSDPATVPEGILQQLNNDAKSAELGERGPFGRRTLKANDREIAAGFGPEEAPVILAIADDRWHGPYNSPQGVHFLRLIERTPPLEPRFEDTRDWIEMQWDLDAQRQILEQALEEMRPRYRVEIQPLAESTG